MSWLLSLTTALHMESITRVTARTAMVHWHDLFVARMVAYDFVHMLSAANGTEYVGVTSNDVVRAVAEIGPGSFLVRGVACHPDFPEAACFLVEELASNYYDFDFSIMKKQPYWFLEACRTALPCPEHPFEPYEDPDEEGDSSS